MRFRSLLVLLAVVLAAAVASAQSLPRVKVLATGGTIAGAQASATDYGYKSGAYDVKTLISAVPNLDKLAGEGIRFTACYSASPVCSPSRAGLMTGRCPSRAGIYDWISAGHPMHLRKEELTLARLLKNSGYSTCHVGKWHLNGRFNSPEQPQPGERGLLARRPDLSDHGREVHRYASPL